MVLYVICHRMVQRSTFGRFACKEYPKSLVKYGVICTFAAIILKSI